MIPGKEIKVIDQNSEYFGVPTIQLMENAGKGLSDFVKEICSPDSKILVLCGMGNNGGDGFVAARYLSEKHDVTVFLMGKPENIKSDIAKINYTRLEKQNVILHSADTLDEIDAFLLKHDIIIDAMLGIGIKGEIREPYRTIVKKINALKEKQVISVDMPTGLGTATAVKPKYTVTFHDTKQGMTAENSGAIKIVDIGIPDKAVECVGPGDLSVYYPRPHTQSHKGDNGKLLVIGGGPYHGAPTLTAFAGLRTGADLVYVASPAQASRIIASFSPNLIVKPLSSPDAISYDDLEIIQSIVHICDAVVIGPGMGTAQKTADAARKLIEHITRADKPLVIDADAIKAIQNHHEIIKNSKTVVTPHAGEFKQLTGSDLPMEKHRKKELVTIWAKRLGVAIFLKGYIDILSDGTMTKCNIVHNEAMTVGGTGDVLAGVIGALLAKGLDPMKAMRVAAFLNGEAGNNAFEKKSYGLISTDVIEEIPRVLKKYL